MKWYSEVMKYYREVTKKPSKPMIWYGKAMKCCGRATKKPSRPVKQHNIAQHLPYRFVQEYPSSF